MEILRWTPFGELDSWERQMRRLFSEVGLVPAPPPAADVYDAGDELVVELEVPGFAESELEIETTDHILHIRGKREEVTDRKEKTFRLHERLEATFDRRFALPPEVDTAKLEAAFEKGILRVRAPKLELEPARKVPIGSSA